jgi:hypothetical protein
VFEVSIDGKVHRVQRQALQNWILRERQERTLLQSNDIGVT